MSDYTSSPIVDIARAIDNCIHKRESGVTKLFWSQNIPTDQTYFVVGIGSPSTVPPLELSGHETRLMNTIVDYVTILEDRIGDDTSAGVGAWLDPLTDRYIVEPVVVFSKDFEALRTAREFAQQCIYVHYPNGTGEVVDVSTS